ncbi:MAG: glycosyltransferase [Magnetococcales bacterium]|nr:glycosyltransferase [Magnetococcales bacterium]
MKRVLFVMPSLERGGAERVAVTLLAGIDRRRYQPELVVFDQAGGLREALPPDLKIHALGCRRMRQAFVALWKLLRRERPEIVFATLGYVNLALLLMRPFLPRGMRLVVREANLPSLSLQAQPYPRLFRWLYRWLYPQADRILVTSGRMRDELVQDLGIPESRIQLLYNPVDVEAIRARAALAFDKPVPHETPYVVAAGRLVRQKGFDRLLQAMIDAPCGGVRLVIMGAGAMEEDLKSLATELGDGDSVELVGLQENPWRWFSKASLFVMPSRWEGMPNAALEALACGTPVLATPESGGLQELRDRLSGEAVVIEPFGEAFLDAMRAGAGKQIAAMRPSLLPDFHHQRSVVDRFMAVFDALC